MNRNSNQKSSAPSNKTSGRKGSSNNQDRPKSSSSRVRSKESTPTTRLQSSKTSTPQRQSREIPSTESSRSSRSFTNRGLHNLEDGISNLDISGENGRLEPAYAYSIPRVGFEYAPPFNGYPAPQPYPPRVPYNYYNSVSYPYHYPNYPPPMPYNQPELYAPYVQYSYPPPNPQSLPISEYKLAVHQSLEESAMEEKLRKADEEALRKALQLSLDEQDQRVVSLDKADQEALQSALIRSKYDTGGNEVGAHLHSDSTEDEELTRKIAIENANQTALDSGVIRSLYDFTGSSDSGGPVTFSSDSQMDRSSIEQVLPDRELKLSHSSSDEIKRSAPKGFQPKFLRSMNEEKEDR